MKRSLILRNVLQLDLTCFQILQLTSGYSLWCQTLRQNKTDRSFLSFSVRNALTSNMFIFSTCTFKLDFKNSCRTRTQFFCLYANSCINICGKWWFHYCTWSLHSLLFYSMLAGGREALCQHVTHTLIPACLCEEGSVCSVPKPKERLSNSTSYVCIFFLSHALFCYNNLLNVHVKYGCQVLDIF